METAIQDAREDVARLHGELVRNGLVVWTGGNVSSRVPSTDLFVIKPSGVAYDDLTADNMILCTLDGNVVEGSAGSERSPSSDTAAHAYVYRHMPEVGGVVHTHSTFAAAWAARGEEIPCVLTAIADEFGGPIPIGPFAIIGDDSIGQGIVETLRGHRSRAVLMQNHGPFTISVSAKTRSKRPSWLRMPHAPCTTPLKPARSFLSPKAQSTNSTTAIKTSTVKERMSADERL